MVNNFCSQNVSFKGLFCIQCFCLDYNYDLEIYFKVVISRSCRFAGEIYLLVCDILNKCSFQQEYDGEDEKDFMQALREFMKKTNQPLGKLPALGFKKGMTCKLKSSDVCVLTSGTVLCFLTLISY